MAQRYEEPEILRPRTPHRSAYIFLAPAMLVLVVFFLYPVVWLLSLSVTDYEPVTRSARSAGLTHYNAVLLCPAVWRAILNTAYFAAVYVPLTLGAAWVIALLLNLRMPARGVLRAMFCSPCVVPVVGAALVWRAAYMPGNGSIDRILYMLGIDHGGAWAGWLEEPYLAMPCIALMCVWRDAGLCALILLSALGRIPRSAYELAAIEGATKRQAFFGVTLPMCLGTLGLCLVMLIINVQNVFQEIYVMTEIGGPANWTVNIPFLVHRMTDFDYAWGRAAALSVTVFAVTIVLIVIQNRMLSRRLNWQ